MAAKSMTITIKGDANGFLVEMDKVGRKIGDVDGAADRTSSGGGLRKLGDSLHGISGLAVAAGAGLFVGIGGALGLGVKVAGDMEQAKIGFTTMLGSAEKADAFIREMQDFAAKTPFEFAGLQASSSKLLAVGVASERVIPLMTVLGDATSAVGTGSEGIDRAVTALGQMQQKGKITGEEMLQLVEAGVPAWDALATVLGVDVAKAQDMVSKGQVPINDLFMALETKAGPALGRVSGMMDKQSGSFMGLLSSLKDTVMMQLGELAQPLMESLKGALPAITAFLGDLMSQLKSWGPQIGAVASSAFDGIRTAFSWLADHREIVVGALVAVGTVWVASMASAAIATLAATWPLLAVIAGITALVAGLLWAYNNVEWFRAGVQTAMAWIGENVPPMWAALQAGIAIVIDWLTTNVVPAVQQAAEWISKTFGDLVTWTQEHWAQISAVIDSYLGVVLGRIDGGIAFVTWIWENWGASLVNIAMAMWNTISSVVTAAVDFVRNVIELVMNVITGNWGGAWNNILGMLSAVWGAITAVVGGALAVVAAVIGGVWSTLASITSGVWGGIRAVIGGVVDFIVGIPGRIAGALSGMWNGLIDGFRGALNWIIDKWNGLGFNLPTIDLGPLGSAGGGRVDLPDMPRLHTGGTYHAPRPGGEGLALLRDGERISTPYSSVTAANAMPASLNRTVELRIDGRLWASATADLLRTREVALR